jgi:hypothetical protein
MRFACFATICTLFFTQTSLAGLITVSELNADSDTGDLEGLPGGDGLGGSLSILGTTPTASGLSAITVNYRLSNVDIDGDGTFAESFDFSITFDNASVGDDIFGSQSTIDFGSTRETFGIGANEEFDPGEAFRLSGSVLSDTSATHDVSFDGFTSIDFVSLTGTITTDTDTFTAVAGDNPLTPDGDVTIVFLEGTGSEGGPVEDWGVQFSTTAVPEPSSLFLILLGGPFALRRRRRSC